MTPNPPAPAPQAAPAPKAPKSDSSKTLLFVVIAIGGAFSLCVCSGIVIAIAVPNFIRFQARAKMAECKTTLRQVYGAQLAYFGEHDDYADRAQEAGVVVAPGSRYTYFAGPEFVVAPTAAGAVQVSEEELGGLAGRPYVGVEGECPDCTFTAACAGNIDTDEALDVWSISTSKRFGDEGELIQAGELFHDLDDTKD